MVAIAGMTGEGVQAMRDAGVESIETLAASADDRPAAMRDPLPRIERAAARLMQTRGEPPSV